MRLIHLLMLMTAWLSLHGASADAMKDVDDVVAAAMKKSGAPGVAVALMSKGAAVTTKGYGFSNVELGVPVSPDTIFQSGSVGKQFTAAVVMLLVEDGKISLDDPVAKYLRDAPKSWRSITVRHLLTHTSGIADYEDASFDLRHSYKQDEIARLMYRQKLEFKPGARWSYSNSGYVLLGIIIGRVSGKFYGDILKERVFGPLGMTSARVISESDIVPNRAAGYRSVDGILKNQEWVAPEWNTTADGSLYLSLNDMLAWERGVRAKAVLQPESWAQVFTPVKLNSGKTYPYGFGWELRDFAGQRRQAHAGAWQGFTSAIARFIDADLTVIVFANHANARSFRLANDIAGKIDARLVPPPLKPIADNEPKVTMRLRAILERAASGKLSAKDFAFLQAGSLPADGYASVLMPLGPLQRVDLLERREEGDDVVYTYDAAFAKRTVRVYFTLAPEGAAGLVLEP